MPTAVRAGRHVLLLLNWIEMKPQDIHEIAEGYRTKIAALMARRDRLQDLIAEYQRRLQACEVLTRPEPSLGDVHEISGEGQSTASTERRFGRELNAFAEPLLVREGPMTVADIYALLPESIRALVKSSDSQFDALFRIRRVFRRSKHFKVDRSTGLVEFVGSGDGLPIISKIYTSSKGTPTAVEVRGGGESRRLSIDEFAASIDRGTRYGAQGEGRVSTLVRDRQRGFLRSFFGGVANDDHRNIERVVEETTA